MRQSVKKSYSQQQVCNSVATYELPLPDSESLCEQWSMAGDRQCHARRRRLAGHTTGRLTVDDRRGV